MADSPTEAEATHEPAAPQIEPVESLTAIHERGWSKLKSLDGNSRIYTFSVLTTLAFSIATLYFDVGFLETDEDEVLLEKAAATHAFTAAGRQIVRALLLLFFCIFLAANCFFLLGINIYPFSAEQLRRHRRWLVLSFISAGIMNLLVIYTLIESQTEFADRSVHDRHESAFSHYLLFIVLLASVLAMNFHFLMAFNNSYQKLQTNEAKGWGRVRMQLSKILRLRSEPDSAPQQNEQPPLARRVSRFLGHLFDQMLQRTLHFMNSVVDSVRRVIGVRDEDEAAKNSSTKVLTWDVSDWVLDGAALFASTALFTGPHRVASFLTWGLWQPLRRLRTATREDPQNTTTTVRMARQTTEAVEGVFHYWRHFGELCRRHVDILYDDVREDEEFTHSAWVLAAMCTSLVLLLYFGALMSASVSGYLRNTYHPRRDCAVGSMENNGELGNFVFRMAGFTEGSEERGRGAASFGDEQALAELACSVDLGIAATQLPTVSAADGVDPEALNQLEAALDRDLETEAERILSQTQSSPPEALNDARFYQCSTDSYSDSSCTTLLLINQLERNIREDLNETKTPSTVFREHPIGRTIYVFDMILQHMRWSIWIGFVVGLAVGIYSLLSVLAQYKRFSLAIRSGFFTDLPMSTNLAVLKDRETNIERLQSVITERRWVKLIELYPMGASVFFFGILVSTAVIQLAVFGGAVALLFAFVASIFDDHVFTILRPYLALLIAFLITWIINGPLAQLVVSEGLLVQKYRVFHELCFLLFLLIYTSVHLVLGVFFALMRLIWVLLTTIACLNRLDRNLFPIMQRNDLGHKSFMSMVLMQHAFLSNADTGEQFLFEELYDRLLKKENQKHATPPEALSMYSTGELDVVVESLMKSKEERREAPPEMVAWYLRDGPSAREPQRPPEEPSESGAGASNEPTSKLPIV